MGSLVRKFETQTGSNYVLHSNGDIEKNGMVVGYDGFYLPNDFLRKYILGLGEGRYMSEEVKQSFIEKASKIDYNIVNGAVSFFNLKNPLKLEWGSSVVRGDPPLRNLEREIGLKPVDKDDNPLIIEGEETLEG